jgi:hypothetical protein
MVRLDLQMVSIPATRVAIVTIGTARPRETIRYGYTCNSWTADWNRLVTVRAYFVHKASPRFVAKSLSRPIPLATHPSGFRRGEAFFLEDSVAQRGSRVGLRGGDQVAASVWSSSRSRLKSDPSGKACKVCSIRSPRRRSKRNQRSGGGALPHPVKSLGASSARKRASILPRKNFPQIGSLGSPAQ